MDDGRMTTPRRHDLKGIRLIPPHPPSTHGTWQKRKPGGEFLLKEEEEEVDNKDGENIYLYTTGV